MAREPLIIIVSAPSGSGKTTLVDRLLERTEGIKRSVSCTTRPPREGEKDGEDYFFLSEEEFEKSIEEGRMLEWEKNFKHYYGTPKAQVEEAVRKGEDIILSIDVKGAKAVKRLYPGSLSIFIMPPSMKELRERLLNRKTEEEEQISMRLNQSEEEIKAADEYDYLVVNDDLEKAVGELRQIIETARERAT
ncbi:MAG: guanylate kinase [Candidatus Omnitrophica bacterium]|nr:guanylate kinase [Candidatus Omnitrophota bacterium]